MSFTIRLEDDIDSIDFVSDATSTFYLLDGTLEMPPPDAEDTRQGTVGPSRELLNSELKNREISFGFQVSAANQATVISNLNRVYRMLARTSNPRALAGGGFSSAPGFNSATAEFSGPQTGDTGLRLVIRYGAAGSASITNEVGQSTTETRLYSFRVLKGNLTPNNPFSLEGTNKLRGKDTLMNVGITLECEPLALAPARVIVSAAAIHGLQYGDSGASSTWTNRIVIPAASVPGTHDALTRLYMNGENIKGVIIGRDAGKSLLNSPSFPGTNLFLPLGIYDTASSRVFNLNVVSVGVGGVPTLRWRVNAGAYSSNFVPTAIYDPIPLEAGMSIILKTMDWTGTAGQTYTWRNNQSSFISNVSTNVFTNAVAYMGLSGVLHTSKTVVIQPGVTGSYKMLIDLFPAGGVTNNYEVKAILQGSNGDYSTYLSDTGWIRCPTDTGQWTADLGVLDLSPSGYRGNTHPLSVNTINISIYLRGVVAPASGHTISSGRLCFIPASDSFSMIRTAWNDFLDNIIMSNFDANAPYFVSAAKGMFTAGATEAHNSIVPVTETHEGNVITLIPGVTNTIILVPLFLPYVTYDYRVGTAGSGDYLISRVDLAIRPRYMFTG